MPFRKPRSGGRLRKRCAFLTGKERDPESNNDYFGARYYFAGNARWLSVDPVAGDISDPQRLNRYSYGLNDPVNYIDEAGADPEPFIRIRVIGRIPPPYSVPFYWSHRNNPPGPPPQAIPGSGWTPPGPPEGLDPFKMRLDSALSRLVSGFDEHMNDEGCTKFFEKIGIKAGSFKVLLDSYVYAGGLENGQTYHVMLADLSTDPRYQQWINLYMTQNQLGPQTTVVDMFANPSLHAWSPPWIWKIFFSPGSLSPEVIGHELLHKATGLVDADLQGALGLTVDEKNTKNISDEFKKKCLE